MAETTDDSRSQRSDGRRPLYVYLPPDIIVSLKKLALDEGTHVYALVEEAVGLLLDARRGSAITKGDA